MTNITAKLIRSALKPGGQIKRAAFKRCETREKRVVAKIRSKGMRGRNPTPAEKAFMDRIAGLGCLACAKDGIVNPWISLHHIDGRVKEGAHFLVLPLCAPHHQQDDTDAMRRLSIHGHKQQFEARYGSQRELLAEAKAKLGIA